MPLRFRLGRLCATPGAIEVMQQANVPPLVLLGRHASGDWGDLCEQDKAANDQSLIDGSRLLSSYTLTPQAKVWVITEAADDSGERACTTILLPQDY